MNGEEYAQLKREAYRTTNSARRINIWMML